MADLNKHDMNKQHPEWRPEWAKGPEWDEWRFEYPAFRFAADGQIVRVQRHEYSHGVKYSVNGLGVNQASTALAIANLIAEDRGGWA